jgi:hypothetical protein
VPHVVDRLAAKREPVSQSGWNSRPEVSLGKK